MSAWTTLVGAVSLAIVGTLGCGGGRAGADDASIDARRDVTERVADAGVDRAVHDAAGQRHFLDAAVVCDGGTGWGPCFLTDAAELACEASTDCAWQSAGDTCCGVPTFGANKNAPMLGCPALPCPAPNSPEPACQELYTQDCKAVAAAADIIVECVDHRCMTRAGSK